MTSAPPRLRRGWPQACLHGIMAITSRPGRRGQIRVIGQLRSWGIVLKLCRLCGGDLVELGVVRSAFHEVVQNTQMGMSYVLLSVALSSPMHRLLSNSDTEKQSVFSSAGFWCNSLHAHELSEVIRETQPTTGRTCMVVWTGQRRPTTRCPAISPVRGHHSPQSSWSTTVRQFCTPVSCVLLPPHAAHSLAELFS